MNPEIASLLEIGEADFSGKVLKAKEPVWALFWAPWSQPCLILLSLIKDIVNSGECKVRVVSINADENLLLSETYQIQSIPTLICFYEGSEHNRMIGTASREAILSRFNTFLDSSLKSSSTSDPA